MTEQEVREQTENHIRTVFNFMGLVAFELGRRAICHDSSKLESPEFEVFSEFTEKLRGSTYGSAEYKQFLADMKPALDHHYANNSHHPEHFPNGIDGMNIFDLVEMLCDWKAATLRHADGNLSRSIEINAERFKMSDQLKNIFKNSVPFFEGIKNERPD